MIRRVTLALRLLLGAVFIYAAYTKLRQSWLLFALSIDSYQLLPEWAVFGLARTLPALELALGVLPAYGSAISRLPPPPFSGCSFPLWSCRTSAGRESIADALVWENR